MAWTKAESPGPSNQIQSIKFCMKPVDTQLEEVHGTSAAPHSSNVIEQRFDSLLFTITTTSIVLVHLSVTLM